MPNPAQIPSGIPIANPVYNVDPTTGLPSSGSSVNVVDPTTSTNKLKVNADGSLNAEMPDATTTGTLTAAQSINGSTAGATVVLAVGLGQSSWRASLAGTFTTSTIVVDHTTDGVNWFASSFKVAGGLQTTPVQSVVGTSVPLEISGNDASVSQMRIRCSALAGGDSISVTMRAGSSIGSIGLLSSIPAGSNLIGGLNLVDSAGTNKAAVDASGNISVKQVGALPAGSNLIGGTNLVDSAGTNKLAVNASGQIALSNIAAANTPSTPIVVEQNIPNWIRAAQGYVAATGNRSPTASNYQALSIFNPNASGKTLYIFRITGFYQTAGGHPAWYVNSETTDPSLSWTSPVTLTPQNLKIGGAVSVLTAQQTGLGNAASQVGTALYVNDASGNAATELLGSGLGLGITVPANSGIAIYSGVGNTGTYAINVFWIEY